MRKFISISLIIICGIFVMITTIIVVRLYNNVYRIGALQKAALLVIWITAYGLIKKINTRLHRIILTICCMITVLISVAFIVFLPTYTVNRAYERLADDPLLEGSYIIHQKTANITGKHGNPFAGYGYTFDYQPEDKNAIRIYFDPITGDYNFTDLPKDEQR